MTAVYVCALTLVLVILAAIIPPGTADNFFKDEQNETNLAYRLGNVGPATSGNNSYVSPKAVSVSQSIVHTVMKILSFGNGADVSTARSKNMMHFMMNPYFLIPQLIMLGFAPVVLANLKMLVMKALMMNNMAFSTALFMTIRSLVFGPSPGPQIKYINYGYRHPHPHHHSHPHSAPHSAPPPHPPRDRRSLMS